MAKDTLLHAYSQKFWENRKLKEGVTNKETKAWLKQQRKNMKLNSQARNKPITVLDCTTYRYSTYKSTWDFVVEYPEHAYYQVMGMLNMQDVKQKTYKNKIFFYREDINAAKEADTSGLVNRILSGGKAPRPVIAVNMIEKTCTHHPSLKACANALGCKQQDIANMLRGHMKYVKKTYKIIYDDFGFISQFEIIWEQIFKRLQLAQQQAEMNRELKRLGLWKPKSNYIKKADRI